MVISITRKNNIQNDINILIDGKNQNADETENKKIKRLFEEYANCDITLVLNNCNNSYFDTLKKYLIGNSILIVEKEKGENIQETIQWSLINNNSFILIRDEQDYLELTSQKGKKLNLEIQNTIYLKYFREIEENYNIENVLIDVEDMSRITKTQVIAMDKIKKAKGIVIKQKGRVGTHLRNCMDKKELYQIYRELLRYKVTAESGKTDIEKLEIAYWLIGKEIEYDFNQDDEASREGIAHSIIGAILMKRAVCEGYAIAFNQLLNMIGIENECVIGKSINDNRKHMWNQVKINGKWYNCDITNDALNIKENRTPDWFLVSDDDYILYKSKERRCYETYKNKKNIDYHEMIL